MPCVRKHGPSQPYFWTMKPNLVRISPVSDRRYIPLSAGSAQAILPHLNSGGHLELHVGVKAGRGPGCDSTDEVSWGHVWPWRIGMFIPGIIWIRNIYLDSYWFPKIAIGGKMRKNWRTINWVWDNAWWIGYSFSWWLYGLRANLSAPPQALWCLISSLHQFYPQIGFRSTSTSLYYSIASISILRIIHTCIYINTCVHCPIHRWI